jgi:hypothetical protein
MHVSRDAITRHGEAGMHGWTDVRDRLTSDQSLRWFLATGTLLLPNVRLIFLLTSFHF